jgi:hypothetical protein
MVDEVVAGARNHRAELHTAGNAQISSLPSTKNLFTVENIC